MEKPNTDSVYDGRYLKLFDEHTKKPNHTPPQIKALPAHKVKQAFPYEQIEVGSEVSISEQFQRMKAEHERIMMIMSGQSLSQNVPDLPKFQYIEIQSQNKIPIREGTDRFNPEQYPQSPSPSLVTANNCSRDKIRYLQSNGLSNDSQKLDYQSKLTQINNKLTPKELVDLVNPVHLYQPMATEDKQIGMNTHMLVNNGFIPKVIDSVKMLNEVMTPPHQKYLHYRKASEVRATQSFRPFQQTFPNPLLVLSRPTSERSKAPNINFAHTQQIPTNYTMLERQHSGLPFSPRSQNFRPSLPNVPHNKVGVSGQPNRYLPLRPSSFSKQRLKVPQSQVQPLSIADPPIIRQYLNGHPQKLVPKKGSGSGITVTIKKK